ncbi:hypothetical protein [Anaerosalibacter massiliensis]|uniref:Uncharacterized protein n=1 Tax=Anaerosalibacter massiliensis TaxID=1347392 RepID=A0A9X2S6B5_9FIRM|nr:hypothetical protein [Anaerosalibacter massiliensis]MCR2045478.1 hypothetical protein [Anaerosalibacter massiliensis]
MAKIKWKTKEEMDQEKEKNANPQQIMSKQIADLAIDNKKKDMLIQNLAKTVSELNIKVQQLGGNA